MRMTLAVVGSILILCLAAYASYIEEKNWQAFVATHDCRLVGVKTSQIATTFIDGKIGTTTTPEQRGYACNDGVTYWR